MKIPARAQIDVKCEVTGPPVVRIIDATLDANTFEYDLTRALDKEIKARGISVESVSFPKKPSDFFAELGAGGAFNTLLLVAHGEVEPSGCLATLLTWVARLRGRSPSRHVEVSGLLCPWLLLGKANADLTDKIVLLAVCGGHCPDSTWTWVTDDHLALLLVASRRAVTNGEVLAVFPSVLEEFRGGSVITPEDLDSAVRRHNVDGAFEVFSGVGIHHGPAV